MKRAGRNVFWYYSDTINDYKEYTKKSKKSKGNKDIVLILKRKVTYKKETYI